MPMDGQVKFFSPQNTSGVLQEKGVAVIFGTIVKINHNKIIKWLHTVRPK